jgi:biotin transport system substrate-specific component
MSRSRTESTSAATVRALSGSPAVRKAAGVLGFAALTALGARVAVPVPGTPVPFTFQVVAVLLAGWMLGPRLGAASQVAYLTAGAAGLPVFAAGGGLAYFLGPTGGYLLAYPAAAAVVGWLVTRRGAVWSQLLALAAGVAVIHAGGVAWLSTVVGEGGALAAGVAPFLAVDALKVVFALLLGRRVGRTARRFFT